MRPGWSKPCSGRLYGVSMKASDRFPTLPCCTKNSFYYRWRSQQDVVLRQEHKAGEKLFVDYAGHHPHL